MKPPFTMPVGFTKLFDRKMQTAIADVVLYEPLKYGFLNHKSLYD